MARLSPVLRRLERKLPLVERAWEGRVGEGGKREAGVLVALTGEARPRVILGRRARHLRLHPGEVAFPGGKREAPDSGPWVTARREAMEEVGLVAAQIFPLGELQPLVTRSRFAVYPCVARVPARVALVVDATEFDSVFLPPLEAFADAARFRLETMSDGERVRKVPHYRLGDDNVWGVTATILAQLANVAYDAGLDLQRE
ncbi:MAG: CoA pyrophosphatase [Halioglobus sp.]|nr:CoA pyrophosphatase [Halioglobus sp.]